MNNREVKIPAVYKHFKHKEDGIINNYLYCTMFLVYPISEENVPEEIMRKAPKITVKHTETHHPFCSFSVVQFSLHFSLQTKM